MMKREPLAIDEGSETKSPKKSQAKEDLAYLPNDIVRLIMKKLPWKNRARLSLVCKSWKELFDESQDREEFLPWVMSFDWDKKRDGGACKLCDPTTQTGYILKEPTQRELFYNALCRDSKNGWGLFSKQVGNHNLFFFYSPFRNEIIELPILNMTIRCYKASFSLNPTSPDCTVLVVWKLREKLCINTCHLGDKSWKTFETSGEHEDHMSFLGVVYAGDYFYCVFVNGELGAFDAKQQEWKLLGEVELPEKNGIVLFHLPCIAFNGDLVIPDYEDEQGRVEWRLRRFDFLENKWVDTDGANMKKHAIFSYSSFVDISSFSVPALGNAKESAGKMHCIYSGTRFIWYSSYFDNSSQGPPKDYEWLEDDKLRKIWIQPPFLKSFYR